MKISLAAAFFISRLFRLSPPGSAQILEIKKPWSLCDRVFVFVSLVTLLGFKPKTF